MRMHKLAIIACLMLSAAAHAGTDIHVVPKNAESGSDGPAAETTRRVAGLEAAREAVSELKDTEGLPEGGVTAVLHGGTYHVSDTFSLNGQYSGAEGSPVVFRAAEGEQVTIAGGPHVPDSAISPVQDEGLLDRLPDAVEGRVRAIDLAEMDLAGAAEPWPAKFRGYTGWPELFWDGEPLTVARWPNEGWAKMKEVVEPGPKPREGETSGKPPVFRYEGDHPDRWAGAEHVYLNGYWHYKWYDECIGVAEVDADENTITLAAPHQYSLNAGHGAGVFYAMNALEELDRPGEYVVDWERDRIYVLPPEGAAEGECAISATKAPLLRLRGTSHVEVRGLDVRRARGRGAVISVRGGERNLVADCTVANSGGSAISISGGSDNGVAGCELYNLGAGGVSLGGGDRETLQPCGNFAEDNHIHHFGRLLRTYQPAVQLSGVGCRMSHNEVHHAPHTAVLFGGNEHTIEFNNIHHVCTDTDDAGAIYSGRDWTERGTVIRHNFIHDLGGGTRIGNQAVYLDDMFCGTRVYGNIFADMGRAIMIGGGRDNVVKNNIAVDCRVSIHIDARGLGWASYHAKESDGTLVRRLKDVPYKEEPWRSRYPELVDILDNRPAAPVGNVVTRNVFVRCEKKEIADEAAELSTIEGNLTTDEDPGFVAPGELDYRLKDDSPVFQKLPDWERIPYDKIGPRQRD